MNLQSIVLTNWNLDNLNNLEYYNSAIINSISTFSENDNTSIFLKSMPEHLFEKLFFNSEEYFLTWANNLTMEDFTKLSKLLIECRYSELEKFIISDRKYDILLKFDSIILEFNKAIEASYKKNIFNTIYIYIDIYANSTINIVPEFYDIILGKQNITNIFYSNQFIIFNSRDKKIEQIFDQIMTKYLFYRKYEYRLQKQKIINYTYEK